MKNSMTIGAILAFALSGGAQAAFPTSVNDQITDKVAQPEHHKHVGHKDDKVRHELHRDHR